MQPKQLLGLFRHYTEHFVHEHQVEWKNGRIEFKAKLNGTNLRAVCSLPFYGVFIDGDALHAATRFRQLYELYQRIRFEHRADQLNRSVSNGSH